MEPFKALITLITLIAVPLLGYVLTGAWWGGAVAFLGWLLATGYFAQKSSQGGEKKGQNKMSRGRKKKA